MTIDEAIRISDRDSVMDSKAEVEARHVIIDAVRKYQKIESKIKVLRHFTEDTPLATQRMIRIINEIREVLEDGKID